MFAILCLCLALSGCGQQQDIAKYFPEIPLETRVISARSLAPPPQSTPLPHPPSYEYFSVDYYDGMAESFDSFINNVVRGGWRLIDVVYKEDGQMLFKLIFEREVP